MPRPLKPYKVEVVMHSNGRDHIEVMFDRDRKLFFAQMGVERAESSDLTAVRNLAKQLVEKGARYEWEAIIVVSPPSLDDHNYGGSSYYEEHEPKLRFEFYRCERAPDPRSGKHNEPRWIVRQHEAEFEADKPNKEARRQRETNCERYGDLREWDGTVYIPYTEEAWQALIAIEAAVVETRKRLAGLLSRDDLPKLLAGIRAAPQQLLALPAGPSPNSRAAKRAASRRA